MEAAHEALPNDYVTMLRDDGIVTFNVELVRSIDVEIARTLGDGKNIVLGRCGLGVRFLFLDGNWRLKNERSSFEEGTR